MTCGTHDSKKKNWRSGGPRPASKNNTAPVEQGFRHVEKMFWYYRQIQKAVYEYRAEQGYYQSGQKTGGGSTNHAFISDPTASLAMKRAGRIPRVIIDADTPYENTINRPEDWLYIIEQTFSYFKDQGLVRQVLERRYLRNEGIWITCCDLNIKKDMYYRLYQTGIRYARDCAIQLGLIRIFTDNRPRVDGNDSNTDK